MRPDMVRFTGLPRVLRGAVLGTAVLLITLFGHSAGYGGGMPDMAPFLFLLPLSVLLSTALAERRLSAAALTGYVVGAQMLMHVLLTVGFSHGAHIGHGPTLIPGPRMLLGHAIATLLVLVVLLYGEDVLHRWIRFLHDLTRAWILSLTPLVDGATTTWNSAPDPRIAPDFAGSVQRRGPPASR